MPLSILRRRIRCMKSYARPPERGVDIAIDCAAQGDTINQCLHAARNAGRVVVTGIPAQDHVNLAFHIMRRKELAFFSVRRSNHDSETALRLLESEPQTIRARC